MYAVFPSSILSMVGCLSVVALYHKFKATIFDEEFKLGYILAWFYLVLSFITLFSPITKPSQDFCTFQGVVEIITGLGGALWTGYIALFLYIKCKQANSTFTTPYCKVLTIIFVICGVSAGVPAGLGYMNYNSARSFYCWYGPDKEKPTDTDKKNIAVFTYVLYYVFIWIVIIWNVYSYCLSARSFSGWNNSAQAFKIAIRLRSYSILMLVFYMPQTIVRIIQSAGFTPDPELLYFSVVLIRLLGLANSIAYGLIPEVKEKTIEMLKRTSPNQNIEATAVINRNSIRV